MAVVLKESSLAISEYKINLSYKEWLNKDGLNGTILFLHGWLDNADSFEPLSPFLNCKRVIAVDLPGHGKSDCLDPVSSYILWDHVFLVRQILNKLEINSNLILGGHSMGAAIAPLFAGVYPKLVSGLVLYDGLGPFYEGEDLALAMQKYDRAKRISAHHKRNVYPSLELAVDARSKSGEISLEACKILVNRSLEKVPDGYVFKNDQRLKLPTVYRLTKEQVDSFFVRIKCPSLLLVPEKSYISKEILSHRKQLIENLELHKVYGNHHFHMDHPKDTANRTNKWLESVVGNY